MTRRYGIAAATLLLVLAGCASTPNSAPVAERTTVSRKIPAKADWRPATHTVQKGETLYGIALEYGFDYRELAELNGIVPPYRIKAGQQLRLGAQQPEAVAVPAPLKAAAPVAEATPIEAGPAAAKPVEAKAAETGPAAAAPPNALLKTQPKAGKVPYSAAAEAAPVVAAVEPAPAKSPAPEEKAKPPEIKPAPVAEEKAPAPAVAGDDENPDWAWPAAGKLVGTFNEGANLKGIDIGGKMGQAVFAAAAGKVVYSGSGLRGYGKLVIIKHNKTYLSAYAHNSQILVKEGEMVAKGQRIAEMGNSDADQVMLHFEIRRLGKPVDPLKHLPEKNG